MDRWPSTPSIDPRFVVRKLGEETLILSEKGDEILTLNEVGSFIWQHIDGQYTLAAILDILCDEYDVERDEAAADLDAYVTELESHGLITWESDDS